MPVVVVQEPDSGNSGWGSLEVWGHLVLALTSSKVASPVMGGWYLVRETGGRARGWRA